MIFFYFFSVKTHFSISFGANNLIDSLLCIFNTGRFKRKHQLNVSILQRFCWQHKSSFFCQDRWKKNFSSLLKIWHETELGDNQQNFYKLNNLNFFFLFTKKVKTLLTIICIYTYLFQRVGVKQKDENNFKAQIWTFCPNI